jgi:hypothetical protein
MLQTESISGTSRPEGALVVATAVFTILLPLKIFLFLSDLPGCILQT